jgi:hypothetical protein
LSLEDKFCYEKIHNKFCKYILGLKKIACNISAKSELERFPKDESFSKVFLLYESFITFLIFFLSECFKEAFSLCKSVDSDGIYTWHSFMGNIFKELDLDIAWVLI